MNPRISYFAVGLFVTVGVAALVILTLWFANPLQERNGNIYLVRFDRDVSGLSSGSTVRYLGVDIGRVQQIILNQSTPPEVEVRLILNPQVRVTVDTYASLAYQGITGIAFINLATSGDRRQALEAQAGSAYPVIPTRETGIAAILSDSSDITSRLRTLLDQLTVLTSDENLQSLRNTLKSVEQFSQDATQVLESNRDSLDQAGEELIATLRSMRTAGDKLSALSDGAAPRLDRSLSALSDAADQTRVLAQRVDKLVAENESAVNSFTSDTLSSVPDTLDQINQAVDEVRRLARDLRRNPSQLVYPPNRQELEVQP